MSLGNSYVLPFSWQTASPVLAHRTNSISAPPDLVLTIKPRCHSFGLFTVLSPDAGQREWLPQVPG